MGSVNVSGWVMWCVIFVDKFEWCVCCLKMCMEWLCVVLVSIYVCYFGLLNCDGFDVVVGNIGRFSDFSFGLVVRMCLFVLLIWYSMCGDVLLFLFLFLVDLRVMFVKIGRLVVLSVMNVFVICLMCVLFYFFVLWIVWW